MLTLLLLACGSTKPGDSASGTDSAALLDTARDSGDVAPYDFVGVPPEAPVALPDFTATNRDGGARGPADLRGSPTVMWFYPAANTFG